MATKKQDVSPTLTRLLKTISKNFDISFLVF